MASFRQFDFIQDPENAGKTLVSLLCYKSKSIVKLLLPHAINPCFSIDLRGFSLMSKESARLEAKFSRTQSGMSFANGSGDSDLRVLNMVGAYVKY